MVSDDAGASAAYEFEAVSAGVYRLMAHRAFDREAAAEAVVAWTGGGADGSTVFQAGDIRGWIDVARISLQETSNVTVTVTPGSPDSLVASDIMLLPVRRPGTRH
jgi:hypothetical protein